jgi:transposase
MNTRIQYVGLDVDDKCFHGHIRRGEEEIAFRTKPNIGSLVEKLNKFKQTDCEYKICYEATYLGFDLQRKLSDRGYSCEIIAPSLIPQEKGRHIKTDRIDSKKMTEYYQKQLLTPVHIPDEDDEKTRDLIRSRKFMSDQLKRVKRHILAICCRNGLNYKAETNKPNGNYWTGPHLNWLKRKIKNMVKKDVLQTNLLLLLTQAENIEQQVEIYDEEICQIAEKGKYKKKVKALSCYRGIATLSAMTLIAEIGDVRRFMHPSKLTSYSGLDLREYSSGGKQKRFGISKMGNRNIRTTVIEVCQGVFKIPKVNKQLKIRREGVDLEMIEIADRCMERLYKKASRMLHKGKVSNKIKVACARELLGFIWESLNAVV